MWNDNEVARLNTFKNLLKLNTSEYSFVITLEDLLNEINNLNFTFKNNFEYIFKTENQKNLNLFKSFISKSVLCFINNKNFTYTDFFTLIGQIKEIKINSNLKIYDLLLKSIQELIEKDSIYIRNTNSLNYSIYNYVQMINKGEVVCEKNILKNYTNRYLVNNKNFEILRLIVGDLIINFFFQNSSFFAFEDKIQNFIQVLGLNLKTKLLNLHGAISMEKYITGPASSNHYSQKNSKSNASSLENEKKNFNGNHNNVSNYLTIPNQTFEVGRTKIFYCPNFNRKMGFLKSSLKEIKKIKKGSLNCVISNVDSFYIKLFPENLQQLIPIYLEKQIRDFLSNINDNIKKINYPGVLFYNCPSIQNWKEKKKEISKKIKSKLNKEEYNKDFELLLNYVIEYESVYKFVASVLKSIIPKKFIGNHNLKVILEKLKIFIEMNRFETFNKISLFELKEFSFNEMKWLEFKNMKRDTYEIVGIKLKNFIMKNIIFWIFDFIVIQLIRSHFYVTERQGHHYKSFYYHKSTWDLIMKINEIKLGAQFELISNPKFQFASKCEKKRINKDLAIQLLKNYDLTYGKLRPMPKPTSCRPIVSYKRKTLKTGSILKNDFYETQKVFKYISNKMQSKYDTCVVFDHKTIVEKLKSFKQFLCNFHQEELKYCTMDIEACYDNINLDKLNDILESDDIIPDVFVPHVLFVVLPKPHMLKKSLFNSNRYSTKNSFTNYTTNSSNNFSTDSNFADCFEVKKLFFASDSNEYLNFLDFLQNKSDLNYSFCIIYQFPEMRSYIRKENFMSRLKVILNNNIIKFNKKFFLQKKGIPQGLSVSSFLCNLYFYNLEKRVANHINRRRVNDISMNKNILLRFVDDYLCISNNKKVVLDFSEESINLSDQHRFKFNIKKSKSNALTTFHDESTKSFNWNGINFELSSENCFNIYIDSKDDYDIKQFFTLINVNLPICDPSWLFKKLTGILLTGHPWIYFIPSINNLKALEKNFEIFCRVVACKFIVLTKYMFRSNLHPGQNTFIDILDSCLKKLFFYFNNKLQKNDENKFFLEFQQFSRIFYYNVYKMFIDNPELINYSPYLFKCIRRKNFRIKILFGSSNNSEIGNIEEQ